MLLPLSILMVCYALFVYHFRSKFLKKKQVLRSVAYAANPPVLPSVHWRGYTPCHASSPLPERFARDALVL